MINLLSGSIECGFFINVGTKLPYELSIKLIQACYGFSILLLVCNFRSTGSYATIFEA